MNVVFIGNRFPVLEAMLEDGIQPAGIFAVRDSFLERELLRRAIEYTPIENRAGLISGLRGTDYDVLVSNGCPYLLPVSGLQNGSRTFINIHPALLPEQRGAHAINSAMLHQYGAGATCHIMDDGVDTGPVIARVEIPFSPDLDLGLLYQLSFSAEVDAYRLALVRGFRPLDTPPAATGASVCFSRRDGIPDIDLAAGLDDIFYLVRAFGVSGQGVSFRYSGETYTVFDAERVSNPYLLSRADRYHENEVVYVYDNTLVLRKGDGFIKLKSIRGDLGRIGRGTLLG